MAPIDDMPLPFTEHQEELVDRFAQGDHLALAELIEDVTGAKVRGVQVHRSHTDERSHVMDETCWCGPTVNRFDRQERPDLVLIDFDMGRLAVAPGDRVAVDDPPWPSCGGS